MSIHNKTIWSLIALASCTMWLARCVLFPAPAASPLPNASPLAVAGEPDPYLDARLDMVREQIEGRGITDERVLAAMRSVPRHLFVPEEWLGDAYADHPLPIGYNQTISQPYVVAWMSELLQVKPGDRVLEVGTGSGYQAAILAELGAQVYTVEIIEELATSAADLLAGMGYIGGTSKVVVGHRDGYLGWEEYAPFDAIVVTCAPDHVPPPLIAQLQEGGRMVLPVGPPGGYQSLFLLTKQEGQVKSRNMGGVRFVPLTRGDG
jgi:protein-L-isoaspartate(D-aspartate) O-methyltransferase